MSIAPISLFTKKHLVKREPIRKLLYALEQDYAHSWPNADKKTKKHRLDMYLRIRTARVYA